MPTMSHIDEAGRARMVDVSAKPQAERIATAQARVKMNADALAQIRDNTLRKGDALGTARIAAILAAKRVDELIPLCHTLPLSEIAVDFEIRDDSIRITTRAKTTASTGVEMEALTAATVAALTIYDMAKAVDRRMVIEDVHLLTKSGGRTGNPLLSKERSPARSAGG
jgi:cyclic pyranopterin phosphate synthase